MPGLYIFLILYFFSPDKKYKSKGRLPFACILKFTEYKHSQ